MVDDVRLPAWSLRAPAGMTVALELAGTVPLASLSLFVGGTVTDQDDLAGATEFPAIISGANSEIATVSVDVPTGSSAPPLRLVVNGVVQTVGVLIPSTAGTPAPSNTIQLTPSATQFSLTVLGVHAAPTADGGTF